MSVFSQLPSKLEILREKRDNAIDNINVIYVQELNKLMNDPSISLSEKMTIANELNNLSDKNKDMNIDKDAISKFIIGKTFVAQTGTIYKFNKNGIGEKVQGGQTLPFLWTIGSDNIVEFKGKIFEGQEDKALFFNFNDKKAIRYGYDRSSMGFPLNIKN